MTENNLAERIASLHFLFNPRSIAIIGASQNPAKPSGQPLIALQKNNFLGKIYPVNPRYQELRGLKCYPTLKAIPDEVDMAIIAIEVSAVLEVLEECGQKGVKAVVVFTSGFAEVGGEGIELQKEMTRLAKEYKFRLLGPNCMGIFSSRNSLWADFPLMDAPEDILVPDYFGFVTQSGGFGCIFYDVVKAQRIGFSHFVSTGNEADIEFSEIIAYMAEDAYTRVIGGYMEGVKSGALFFQAAEKALEKEKPVILIKTGRYETAARAAASHTGAMVGSDKVYDAFFRQKGIIRVESIDELTALLLILAAGKIPRGNRVGILSASGGTGVLLADKCAEYGLEVVSLAKETQEKIKNLLPDFASYANPVDLTSAIVPEPGLLFECAHVVSTDPNIDVLLICFYNLGVNEAILNQIIKAAKTSAKTVVNIVWGDENVCQKQIRYLNDQFVPAVREMEVAVKALSSLIKYNSRRQMFLQEKPVSLVPLKAKEDVAAILAQIVPEAKLTEEEAKQILKTYDIPVAKEEVAASPEEAVAAAARIGYPVVLKILSPDILHKTEAGGVKLNLDTPEKVLVAYKEIITNASSYRPGARIKGVLVQEMLPAGVETIIGISQDPVFGPVVMFGLGGIFVEVLQDVALRVVPLTKSDAYEMIDEIKGRRILDGVRGQSPVNKSAIAEVILKVAQLAQDFPQIKELDINPLICSGKEVWAADALIVLR
jgi:acetyltransferase